MTNQKKIIIYLTFLVFPFSLYTQPKSSLPPLQLLTRSEKTDSNTTKIDSTQKITADSAKIISPEIRSIVSVDTMPIEVVPRCPVDSITVLIRYSGKKIDTLGTFSHPPYRAIWNCKNIPDQDQMNLQPGYILFHKSGLKIISPPLAHRWVLDRKMEISKKKYRAFQKDAPDTSSIDGDIEDWKNVQASKIGDKGYFKVFWSGKNIFLAAWIFDNSVTYRDFVEFHFDIYNNKNEFAGINHRSISFGPRLRSNCFTVNLTDSGFILADSVNVLISREMRWAKRIYPDGYSIEVSVPVFVLSDLQYPPKSIGFDISVIDVDEHSNEEFFASWSGSEISNRYNPSQWGNLVLEQAMYPLRMAVISGITLFLIVISILIGIQLIQYYKNRNTEQTCQKEYSEFMNSILECIQKSLYDPQLSPSTIANSLSCTTEEITNSIHNEAECTFEQFVCFQKIKLARALLRETDHSLEKISEMTGFKNVKDFNRFFTETTRSTPEKYRQIKRDESDSESEENES
jgi:AraC-like DNA-binding protein